MRKITIVGAQVEFDLIRMPEGDFVLARINGQVLGAFSDEEMAMDAVAYRLEQRHRAAGSQLSAA